MSKFFEDLKANTDVFRCAVDNGAEVIFMEKGSIGSDKQEENLIVNTNAKFFNSDSKVLMADFVVLKFENGGMVRIEVAELEQRFNDSEGEWGSIESLIISQTIAAVNLSAKIYSTIEKLGSYEEFKENLIVRPINVDINRASLQGMLFKTVGDIALVIYGIASDGGEGLNTFKIPADALTMWDMKFDEVFDYAMKNTQRMAKAEMFLSLLDTSDPCGAKDFMNEDVYLGMDKRKISPLITTSKRLNGAIAMFYPGAAERLAEIFGDGYLAAFTSIHECMIHRANDGIDPDTIRRSLADVSKHFGDEETLSLQAYRYNAETKSLEVIK